MDKYYICIDLKTFFASVECVERNLDPFNTNLVVADPNRGNGALCLAITPKMKKQGVKNRCRLFEIPRDMEYITAMPRMNKYMEYAANVYQVYLKYIAADDIHVYSIDEAFLDVSNYLKLYQTTATKLAKIILADIYATTKITATVGVGTNMYLAKVALDIIAKNTKTNMGCLNEELYQKHLWHHQPLTDFWHVGSGIAKRLLKYNINTMYDIAHFDKTILKKEFGVNALLLYDHAWGIEPTTIKEIKNYQTVSKSISASQILFEDYSFDNALIILKEMVELKALDLVRKHLVTNRISLHIGYSNNVIKGTNVTRKISIYTNSYEILKDKFVELYLALVDRTHSIRQVGISFNNILDEYYESYDLFSNVERLEDEKKIQEALIKIKDKYGKNSILKGMNFLDKATTIKRNTLVGGHNAK